MSGVARAQAVAEAVSEAVVVGEGRSRVVYFNPERLDRVMRAITSPHARELLVVHCNQEMTRQVLELDADRALAALRLLEKVERPVRTTWVIGPDGDFHKLN